MSRCTELQEILLRYNVVHLSSLFVLQKPLIHLVSLLPLFLATSVNEVQSVVDFRSCKGKQNCSIRLLRKASFVLVNYFGHWPLLRRKNGREQGIMLCEQVRLS